MRKENPCREAHGYVVFTRRAHDALQTIKAAEIQLETAHQLPPFPLVPP